MKSLACTALILTALILSVTGCKNSDENPDPNAISGKITNQSECKNFKSAELRFTEPDTFSCALFSYDEAAHKLILNHVNSGFNCCPEEISCEVSLKNDTILIIETEKMQGCNCNCLFDLEIEVNNVVKDLYQVKFVEPYALEMTPLIFQINLNENSQGEYCVVRKGYPWGGEKQF